MIISYPRELVSEIENEFGIDSNAAVSARIGDFSLGVYLSNGILPNLSSEEIITIFEDGNSDKILKEAKSRLKRRELHKDWMKLVTMRIKEFEVKINEFNCNVNRHYDERFVP